MPWLRSVLVDNHQHINTCDEWSQAVEEETLSQEEQETQKHTKETGEFAMPSDSSDISNMQDEVLGAGVPGEGRSLDGLIKEPSSEEFLFEESLFEAPASEEPSSEGSEGVDAENEAVNTDNSPVLNPEGSGEGVLSESFVVDRSALEYEAEIAQLERELDDATSQKSELQERLIELEEELEESKAKMLRAVADRDNYRKRAEREKEDLRKYGGDRIVQDLLPAVDNLERALEHAGALEDVSSISEGVHMVHKQLVSALDKHGVKGFVSKGQPFDPTRHEAIQQVETTEFDTNVVMQEYQKGYFFHDRLLRPAMVVVAKYIDPPMVVEESSSSEEDFVLEEVPPLADDAKTLSDAQGSANAFSEDSSEGDVILEEISGDRD